MGPSCYLQLTVTLLCVNIHVAGHIIIGKAVCVLPQGFKPMFGGPEVQFTARKQYNVFPSFMGAPSMCHCRRETLNSGLLYSSGYYRTKTGNVLCEIREGKR